MNEEKLGLPCEGSWFVALVVMAATLAGTPLPGFAQFPGERVRIGVAAGTMTGVVVETRGDGLRMSLDGGGLRWVAKDEVVRLERSLGFRSNARNGLLIGAGVGAVLGVTGGWRPVACATWYTRIRAPSVTASATPSWRLSRWRTVLRLDCSDSASGI